MSDFGIRVCEKYSTGVSQFWRFPIVIFTDKITKKFVDLTGWDINGYEVFTEQRFKVYENNNYRKYVKYENAVLFFNEYEEEDYIEDGGNISSPELNEVALHPETPPLYEEEKESPPSYSPEPELLQQGREYRDLMKDYQELEGQYDDVAEKNRQLQEIIKDLQHRLDNK